MYLVYILVSRDLLRATGSLNVASDELYGLLNADEDEEEEGASLGSAPPLRDEGRYGLTLVARGDVVNTIRPPVFRLYLKYRAS